MIAIFVIRCGYQTSIIHLLKVALVVEMIGIYCSANVPYLICNLAELLGFSGKLFI